MSQDIAVIGLGAVFPGAPDVHSFWRNIEAGVDAITELPEGRWDEVFYDPDSTDVDRVYCKRGGFLGGTVPFDAGAFGIMPVAARGAEPDQMLALDVAAATLADAGVELDDAIRRNTTVVLGRGSYVTAGMVRLDQKVRGAQQVTSLLEQLVPGLDASVLAEVKKNLQSQAGLFGPDTAIGLVPNLTASRIANRLDLQGPAYTVDAACASALLAVEHGVRELRSGRASLALVGGVHLTQDITFWSVFAQLGALSRNQQIRPLSASADGLLIGEGIGMLALQRLEDAVAADRRIYAVLHGVGSASDGRASSVMVPRVDGQLLALERAWEDAGLDRNDIGLVEAHGTATAAGDGAEISTLARFFGPAEGERAAVGSVKSMIGHTMPAAGAAGLIKAVLAVHHGVLPPSLHCDDPNPELEQTRFRVPTEAEAWTGPRLAAVNAFGFGGIDAHVVVGQAPPRRRTPRVSGAPTPVVLAAPDAASLVAMLRNGQQRGGEGHLRIALLDDTPKRRSKAVRVVEKGKRWHGRGGIWFSPDPLGAGAGVAVLFPGVEARFDPDVAAIAEHFSRPVPEFSTAENLEQTGMGLVQVGRLLHDVLQDLGVPTAAYAGHSVGEWVAMICSGAIPAGAIDGFLGTLEADTLEVPGVLFAAAGCGVTKAQPALEGLDDIAISHDNCTRQILLCGAEDSIRTARDRLVEAGVMVQILPFRSGFHSPLFGPYLEPMREHLRRLTLQAPPRPLYSATTASPFPEDPEAIRALAIRHLVEPVRFRELTEALYADGVRVFLQLGQGSLTGFVGDTLKGREHLVVGMLDPKLSGMTQLHNAALALWVEGVEVDLDKVLPGASTPRLMVDIDLRTPLLQADTALPLRAASGSRPTVASSHPVMAAFERSLDAVDRARDDVLDAWNVEAPASSSRTMRLSVEDQPYLRDHAFFPQPDGWPNLADTHPLVPMTMIVELLIAEAEALLPGKVAVAVEGMTAVKWLAVHPAVEVQLIAEEVGHLEVDARIDGYAWARIRLADAYPARPAPSLPALADPRPTPLDAETLYADRWMFHGPQYQGIASLDAWDDTGIEGTLRTPAATGALVDNAGQIFGYWLMCAREIDRLALPVELERIERFGPHPEPDTLLTCRVQITECSDDTLTCNLEIFNEDGVWCRISNWSDRRFPNDPHMWRVMRQPEHNLLCDELDGAVVFDESRRRIPSREWISRCFLVERERSEMLAAGPRRQRDVLHGRIAVKDAVRRHLRQRDGLPVFPAEVEVSPGPTLVTLGVEVSRSNVTVGQEDFTVLLAIDDHVAVARIDERPGGLGLCHLKGAEARLPSDVLQLERQLALQSTTWAARVLACRVAMATAEHVPTTVRLAGGQLVYDDLAVHSVVDGNLAIAWLTVTP